MLNKFITLSICIITLNSCSFSSQKTKDKLEGKYILIEGKSIYNSFSFKGQSTIVIESFGMEFVTSYVKDEDYLRIEAEPSHLLLKIQSKDTIVGEGFASGIYIKESLWKKSQAAKTSDIKQDTIASVPLVLGTDKQSKKKTVAQSFEESMILAQKKEEQQKKKEKRRKREEAEKKRLEEEHRKKEQAINNRVAGAFGIGGAEGNRQGDAETGTDNQGSPFGNSAHHGANGGVGGYGSFNLNGRSIGAGGLPRPAYKIQEEGKIIVKITVDPKGNVIFAEIGNGTNIDNASMRKSALDAAKRTKFNSINGANNQSGTITYVYKLK